jgi:hypothetical protein
MSVGYDSVMPHPPTDAANRPAIDPEPLRSDRLASGFHGVYRRAGRGRPWVAKGYRRRRLGTYDTAAEAARAVARHWHALYGSDWPALFRARLALPWAVMVDNRGGLAVRADGRLGAVRRGYRLHVWVHGRRRVVPPPDPRADLFATYDEGRDYYRVWCRARFGVLAPLAVRKGL